MDILTVLGLVSGVAVICLGILSNGSLRAFWDIGSIFITIGGTLSAIMINFPLSSLKTIIPSTAKALLSKEEDPYKIIDNIVELSEQARKGGLLSLEEKVIEYNDEFLKRGVMTIIDSHDSETVREVLETEISYIHERHVAVKNIYEKGAAYAPAFGMIGTLIGLINMLKHLDNPDSLGPNMSIAMVTTFYGAMFANMFFIPIAGKLKVIDQQEMFCKQLIIEGILSIQVGENPRLIKDKLLCLLPPKSVKKKLVKTED